MIPFIYSDQYVVDIGNHVFPVEKYRLIRDRLKKIYPELAILEPSLPSEEDLLRIHTPTYLDDLRSLRWTEGTLRSELPITQEIVNAYILGAGGTILTCEMAFEKGIALHIGGGFHHAFSDHAEGFCYINDVAVGIYRMQKMNRIKRAVVIDCDLHQGNGTAKIFSRDPTVFTFSIHQENLYPMKEESDLDISLPDFTGDEVYLEHLRGVIPGILDRHRPDFVIYLAGADPYEKDQLGSLRLTQEGLRLRDEFVLKECRERGIPVGITLAGGYALDTRDTIEIHLNTCLVAMQVKNEDGNW